MIGMYESVIVQERKIHEREMAEHIRLCNAGVNQKHHIWVSEEERTEFNNQVSEWMRNMRIANTEILESLGLTE